MSDTTAFPAFGNLFFTPVRSEFSGFLFETYNFWLRNPKIQAAVAADLDAAALARKRLRQADKAFELERSGALFAGKELPCGCAPEAARGQMELEPGRPRAPDALVFIAAMAQGFMGGIYGSAQWTLMLESMSLRALLDELGVDKLPASNTLGPHIAAISQPTLDLIHRAQLAEYLDEGLDSFQELAVDSTAVKASSAWPTDSSLIRGLLERAFRLASKLDRFGLDPLAGAVARRWLDELDKLAKAIAPHGKGQRKQRRLKTLYTDFFVTACDIRDKLAEYLGALGLRPDAGPGAAWREHAGRLAPTARARLETVLERIRDDCSAATTTLQQSIDRIATGVSAKARERVLSLADKSAAWIEKGGREPVVGYKPQLARSGEGFVAALLVEEGNGADSKALVPLVEAAVAATRVVPSSVTADDGYPSASNLASVKALGVGEVSFSGSKGRLLLGDELYFSDTYSALRDRRSPVESLMFTLKFNHGFGRPGRRGIESVRHELMLKVLAYNFDRAILLRQRRQEQERRRLAPAA